MTVSPPDVVPAGTIGRRAGAFAVDIALAALVAAALVGLGTGTSIALAGVVRPADLPALLLFTWCGVVVLLLGWWLVYCGLQGGHGSVGQRLLGLRLADASSGAPIGFWRAVWRNVVFGLAGSIVVGYFTPLFDASGRRQGWHDLAAGAIVVDARTPHAASAPTAETRAVPVIAGPVGASGRAVPPLPAPPLPPAAAPARSASAADLSWLFQGEPAAPAGRPEPAEPFPGFTMPFPAATTTEPFGRAPAPRAVATVEPPRAEEDLDVTRTAVPPPAERAALYAEAPVIVVLTWDDGSRMAVYGRTLYGRNPATEPGAVAIAVRDETLSLSKTHFEIGGDAAGAWVADRHSTNGTTLVRDGSRIALVPGLPTTLRAGDTLELGDRRVTVGAGR